MGVNVGMNAITSGGLGISTILLVIMGILLVSASNKVHDIPEYESSSGLKKAHDDLKTAYWLIFIAAGVLLLLSIAYGGHETAWCPSEWIHSFIFVLVFVALIIGIIYAYIVLNDLYNPELEDTNGATSFIWASLLIGAIAFMGVAAVGTGRIGYNAGRGDVNKRVRHAEDKVHEMHSAITGKPNDFVPPVDHCASCEEPETPCGPAPVPAVMVAPVNQGPDRLPPVQQYQPRPQYQPTYQSQYQPTYQSQEFVGPPTVTRHSTVTTSQPMVTTSSPRRFV